jgi:hypothetical protein
MAGSHFKHLCSKEEKHIAKEIEDIVRCQRKNISDEEIFQEVKDWFRTQSILEPERQNIQVGRDLLGGQGFGCARH